MNYCAFTFVPAVDAAAVAVVVVDVDVWGLVSVAFDIFSYYHESKSMP